MEQKRENTTLQLPASCYPWRSTSLYSSLLLFFTTLLPVISFFPSFLMNFDKRKKKDQDAEKCYLGDVTNARDVTIDVDTSS